MDSSLLVASDWWTGVAYTHANDRERLSRYIKSPTPWLRVSGLGLGANIATGEHITTGEHMTTGVHAVLCTTGANRMRQKEKQRRQATLEPTQG